MTSARDSKALRYLMIGELGHGGMGRVHRAYDPVLEREVAIKEVHTRLLQSASTTGLLREARTMAQLSHPNVVAVYDVQELPDVLTPAGFPVVVIVMELVDGVTLSTWLSAERRSWQEILARFAAAGRGLAAAHDAGILHRDVKPSNIMLPSDGKVLAKIADFGLAVSDGGLNEIGPPRRVGTLHYQSTEQLRGAEATAASDQYAFCLALREALTHRRVFEGAEPARQKRRGPPPWPSVAVPRRIMAAIDRGLAPRPEARWPSMEQLLDNLTLRSWFTQPRAVVSVGVGSAALASGAVVMLAGSTVAPEPCGGAERHLAQVWSPEHARRGRDAFHRTGLPSASERWQRAEEVLDDYANAWVVQHEAACRASEVFHEQSADALDLRMGCLFDARASLRAGVELFELADDDVVLASVRVLESLPPLADCDDVLGLEERRGSAPLVLEPEAREAELLLARANAKRLAMNLEASADALDAAERKLQASPHVSLQIDLLLQRARNAEQSGDFEQATTLLDQAIAVASSVHRWQDVSAAAISQVRNWGLFRREPLEARRYEVLALRLATTQRLKVGAHQEVGRLRSLEGDKDAALEHLEIARRGAGSRASWRVNLDLMLAEVFVHRGEFDRAKDSLERALQLALETFGEGSVEVARARVTGAQMYKSTGNLVSAREQFERALQVFRAPGTDASPIHVATVEGDYAATLIESGHVREGIAEADAALARLVDAQGPGAALVTSKALQSKALGVFDHGAGDGTEALRLQQQAIAKIEPVHDGGSPELAQARIDEGVYLLEVGDFEQAERQLRSSLRMLASFAGASHPVVRARRYLIVLALSLAGEPERGVAEGRMAWAQLGDGPIWSEARVHTAMALAVGHALLDGDANSPRVRHWVDLALEWVERARPEDLDAFDRDRVIAWKTGSMPSQVTAATLVEMAMP